MSLIPLYTQFLFVLSVDTTDDDLEVFHGVIWVFANISGMITILPNGQIHSINDNFAMIMFGYTQQELVGKVCGSLSPHVNYNNNAP